MLRKTKAIVKSRGSKNHDEEEEALPKITKILYTRPPPLPYKCPNFVIFNLDGTPSAVRTSWRWSVLYLRLWCFNNTDQRYQFGDPQRSSCMIPDKGKFFIYMHWKGNWICAVIDGPSLYLDGYITRSVGKEGEVKVRENDSNDREGPILIERSKALPWPGNYKRAQTCKLGYNGILPSVKTMFVYVQTGTCKSSEIVEFAGETIILHFPEAARSDDLYEDIDNCFFEGEILGMERLKAARRWSKESKEAKSDMQCVPLLDYGDKSEANRESYSAGSTKIIENIRLMYRPDTDPVHAKLLLKNMPVQLGVRGPVGDVWAMQRKIDKHMSSFRFLIKRFSLSSKTNGGFSSTEKLDREIDVGKTQKVVHSKSTEEYNLGSRSVAAHDAFSVIDKTPVSPSKLLEALREKHPISAEQEDDPYRQYVPSASLGVKEIQIVGLHNFGQSCYMNSTIQCMNSIPELKNALSSYARNGRRDWIESASHELTVAAHDTFSALDISTTPVRPSKLFEALHKKHPTFAEREHDFYKQQDAEECWSVLVNTFSNTLASEESDVDQMKETFGITLASFAGTGECLKTQSMKLIRCAINDGVKHLHEVLEQSLKMGNSLYEKNSKIDELPRQERISPYNLVGSVMTQGSKKFDKVNHPLYLDVYEYCSDEQKHKLQPHREVLESAALGSSSMDIDQVGPIVPKTQLTGMYKLVAVVTHKGPTPNVGHYVAWVKQENGVWIQFSDTVTSTHEDEEILKLTGGAEDQHVPYIYLYKAA